MLPLASAPIGEFSPKSYDLLGLLNTSPNEEAFDLFCEENPDYKLSNCLPHGATLADFLLEKGNHDSYKLLLHIIQLGGKTILNVGNQMGMTPLLSSVFSVGVSEIYSPIKELPKQKTPKTSDSIKAIALCHLGADVNLTNAIPFTCPINQGIPKGATPLWVAVEKTSDLDLVITLLSHGAHTGENPLSKKGQAMIEMAQSQLKAQCTLPLMKNQNTESLLDKIPNELNLTINHYSAVSLETKIIEDYSKWEKLMTPKDTHLLNMIKI